MHAPRAHGGSQPSCWTGYAIARARAHQSGLDELRRNISPATRQPASKMGLRKRGSKDQPRSDLVSKWSNPGKSAYKAQITSDELPLARTNVDGCTGGACNRRVEQRALMSVDRPHPVQVNRHLLDVFDTR